MNYIIHLNKAFATFCEDERLTPFHISLYFTLFQFWNLAKFRNPISISRDEVMRGSRIGSVNTYIRSIKDLHDWKYLQYQPSYNPLKGSKVHMFNFDNANNKSQNNGNTISAHHSAKKAQKKAPVKTAKTLLIPSKNNSNIINKTNKSKQDKHASHRSKNNAEFLRLSGEDAPSGRKRKVASKEKEVSGSAKSRLVRPLLSQVKTYFSKNQWPDLEAQKFFNYYSSNGWLVGGKTPMRNWKAAANNWILNSQSSSGSKSDVSPIKKLHAKQNKNYGEPL